MDKSFEYRWMLRWESTVQPRPRFRLQHFRAFSPLLMFMILHKHMLNSSNHVHDWQVLSQCLWDMNVISNTSGIIFRRKTMMPSSNGRIFASLALCAGTSPVTDDIPSQRPATRSFDAMLSLIYAWTNGWVNNRDAAHYDFTAMISGRSKFA